MDNLWQWICELPNSDQWGESSSNFLTFEIGASKHSRESIFLKAHKTSSGHSGSDEVLTFYLFSVGFNSVDSERPLWVSHTCPLSSDHPFLPIVLQLLQIVVSNAPTKHVSMFPDSEWKIKPDPIIWIMNTHSPETFSSVFSILFLSHLFCLCVLHASSEIGSFYFHSLLSPNIEIFSSQAPILRTFLVSVGADVELCVMRTFGYMLAKWLILKEVNGVGLQTLSRPTVGFSYATETHGLWVMKGYTPVWGMSRTLTTNKRTIFSLIQPTETVLRYALAHQQLEAVIQLEYSVTFEDGFILVKTRVDNIRLHVTKLGYRKNGEEDAFVNERHFPSRVRVCIGPEVGSTYVVGLSLGRSTDNTERQVEMHRVLKGRFSKAKVPKLKATERSSMRTKVKKWRWDQDAEGNTAVFDTTLCDSTTGTEVTTLAGNSFQKRYAGAQRSFTKSGGLVFSKNECGEEVAWRLSRSMEGSVLRWRFGCQIWLSYSPNEVPSSYFETRCVEWYHEVDLPIIVAI